MDVQLLIMQKYWPSSTRHFNLSVNCAMNCMTTTSFSQPVAGAWCTVLGDRGKQRCSPKTKWQTPGTKIETFGTLIMHTFSGKVGGRPVDAVRPCFPAPLHP